MATDYPTDPFTILRNAMYGIVAERYETETARGNPDPHYLQHLKDAGDAIFEAQSFSDLACVQWIQGQSALGMDYL